MNRVSDPEKVNACVRRDFPGADLTEAVKEKLHICLMEGESGAIFMWRGPGVYEAHLFFERRGKEAAALINRMIVKMSQTYGAKTLWALIPIESRHVRMFARMVGWKSHGFMEMRTGPNELFVLENV